MHICFVENLVVQGTGKSSVALNLAMAQEGKDVRVVYASLSDKPDHREHVRDVLEQVSQCHRHTHTPGS